MITSMCKQYEHTIAITNRALVQGDFLKQMQKVIHLHPHAVILREKDLSDDAYEALAEKILCLCDEEGVRCFLHSRIAIAHNLGCRRIHLSIPALGAMSEAERIRLQRDFAEISVSCHSLEDVKLAGKNGATQIILGTIFETECKKGLKGKGLGFVEAICKSCPLPVYAIGGISLERLPQVRKAGAAGGCMMSGFMKL
ncbi:MAG: thiamine phosphate synthase [Lachnospiraceae bacterium]